MVEVAPRQERRVARGTCRVGTRTSLRTQCLQVSRTTAEGGRERTETNQDLVGKVTSPVNLEGAATAQEQTTSSVETETGVRAALLVDAITTAAEDIKAAEAADMARSLTSRTVTEDATTAAGNIIPALFAALVVVPRGIPVMLLRPVKRGHKQRRRKTIPTVLAMHQQRKRRARIAGARRICSTPRRRAHLRHQ